MIEMSGALRKPDQLARGTASRLIFAILASSALTPLAHAEETVTDEETAAADTTAPADEIIVTGESLDTTNLMEVPMAVTSISGETLKDLRITSMKDLTSVAPSFRVTRSYQGTPQYSIRGIGFNAVNMSATPTVGVYQDDVAYPYPFTQLGPVFDLAGAQVLKGPQGTIFGRNTTAGVIKLDSNQPTDSFEGSFATEVGNYQTLNFEGFVSGPIAPWLNARLAFRTENSMKGWQKSKSRPDERLGEIHNHGLRLILDADPAPGLDIKLTLNGWHNDSDTRAMQALALTPGTDRSLNPEAQAAYSTNPALIAYLGYQLGGKGKPLEWANGRLADWASSGPVGSQPGRAMSLGSAAGMPGQLKEDTSFWSANLDLGYDLADNLRLVSLSSFQKLRRDSLQDVSGAPFEVLVQNPKGTIESLSEELRLAADLGRFKLSVGGYYGRDKIKENIRSLIFDNSNSRAIRDVLPTFGFVGQFFLNLPEYRKYLSYAGAQGGDPNYTGPTIGATEGMFRTLRDTGEYRVTTKSVLANADWAITDTLSLAVGGRYTWDNLHFEGCTRDVNGNTIQGTNTTVAFLIASKLGQTAIPLNLAGPGECVTMDFPVDAEGNITGPGVRGLVINDLKEENFSWRGALTFRPLDELMLYASASRGYKSGVNPLNTASASTQNAAVKQEKLTAFEGGLRTDFGNIKIGVGGFYYDYRDKQISGYYVDPVFTTLARLVNIPKSRAYGIEGDFSIEPTPGFTLFGNVLHLKTKILDDIRFNELGRLADFRGSSLGNPEWSLSGGMAVETPIDENFAFRGIVNYRWQSKSGSPKSFELTNGVGDPAKPSASQDFYDIAAYGVLDASVTILDANDQDWELSIWGRNLTQKAYAISVNSNATTIFRIPGDPRTYGATFRVNF